MSSLLEGCSFGRVLKYFKFARPRERSDGIAYWSSDPAEALSGLQIPVMRPDTLIIVVSNGRVSLASRSDASD